MKRVAGENFRARRLPLKVLLLVLGLQVTAFAAAGAALFLVFGFDLAKDFYSAHHSIKSVRELLLPAVLLSGTTGFVLVAAATWFGMRYCSRKFAEPVQRADELIQRLGRGDFSHSHGIAPGRDRWELDDTADAMLTAFRERIAEVRTLSREIHNAVLSLQYKATGKEALTLKDLRAVSNSLEDLCKRLNASVKWFET